MSMFTFHLRFITYRTQGSKAYVRFIILQNTKGPRKYLAWLPNRTVNRNELSRVKKRNMHVNLVNFTHAMTVEDVTI
jgi:hypothetical protein